MCIYLNWILLNKEINLSGQISILSSFSFFFQPLPPPSHSNRPLEKGSIGTKHDISGKLTLRLFFDPLEGSQRFATYVARWQPRSWRTILTLNTFLQLSPVTICRPQNLKRKTLSQKSKFGTGFLKKITWIFKELCLCWFSSNIHLLEMFHQSSSFSKQKY